MLNYNQLETFDLHLKTDYHVIYLPGIHGNLQIWHIWNTLSILYNSHESKVVYLNIGVIMSWFP